MIEQLRPAELAAWFAQARGAHGTDSATPLLLDVREPWELHSASVAPEGFALLAIPMHEIPARLAELGAEDRPIACLCHHGVRSQRVALFLAQQGYRQLANVAGGIDAWSATLDARVPRY